MKYLAKVSPRSGVRLNSMFALAFVILLNACADRPSPDARGGRGNEPPYPVLMTDSAERRDAALAAWAKITNEQRITNAPPPDFQRVTATVRGLPSLLSTPLYLPKLGLGPVMSEEETRESLRRFITGISSLIGAEPQQLTLVQRTDLADGMKKARYEQRPFRFPLRGNYGVLEITFAPDRRLVQITSTCIPEVEQFQRAAVGIRPRWTAERIPERIAGRTFTYAGTTGNPETITIAKGDEITVRELVIYPLPRPSDPSILEFHLAWEITIGPRPSPVVIFVDAVTDNLIAVQQTSN